jgi:hypothetical protein
MGWDDGMVSSSILAQLLLWVLVGLQLDFEEVPAPLFMKIYSPNDLPYSI